MRSDRQTGCATLRSPSPPVGVHLVSVFRAPLALVLAHFFAMGLSVLAAACSALASTEIPVRVSRVIRMSVRALGLSHVFTADREPAVLVDLSRDCFQVPRVDAATHTAQVVDFETFRNLANDPAVHDPVGVITLPPPVPVARNRAKDAIAIPVRCGSPKPTLIDSGNDDLLHEPLTPVARLLGHWPIVLTLCQPREVVMPR